MIRDLKFAIDLMAEAAGFIENNAMQVVDLRQHDESMCVISGLVVHTLDDGFCIAALHNCGYHGFNEISPDVNRLFSMSPWSLPGVIIHDRPLAEAIKVYNESLQPFKVGSGVKAFWTPETGLIEDLYF